MIRRLPVRSRSLALFAGGLALLAGAATFAPHRAAAQDLIEPKRLDRRFPAFLFCPLPVSATFTADGVMATLQFKGNIFAAGPFGTQYCGQRIDGIAVCATGDFAPNFGFPPSDGDHFVASCYTGNHVGAFFYNRAGLTLPLLEQFDTDPTGRGWDMAHGAEFDPTTTGPRNPETNTDYSGGSLLLGADTPGGTPADTATTSIAVTGLVQGQSYTVSGWWFVGNIPQDSDTGDPLLNVTLSLRVFGDTSTPIMTRTWGGLKAAYR